LIISPNDVKLEARNKSISYYYLSESEFTEFSECLNQNLQNFKIFRITATAILQIVDLLNFPNRYHQGNDIN